METVRFARLSSPTTVTDLGDGGQSLQGLAKPRRDGYVRN
jgi:hypothetical protein